jgi:3-oxoacyl-[acyl-carrier protein] reductase
MDTEMTAGLGEADRARIAARSALKRLVEVEDVAAAVSYLMSDAAKNVTGTTITVDAGNTA